MQLATAFHGAALPADRSSWQSGLALAFVVVCLGALEVYVGAGVIVAALPLLAATRTSLQALTGFALLVALKTLTGLYVDMGAAFAIYAFSWSAAVREYTALAVTLLMFVLGYRVMTRTMFDRLPSGGLLLIPLSNIILHAVTRKDILAATADNTQILSLYVCYLVATRKGDNAWPLIALVIAIFMGAGLRNSFTSVAAVMVLLCYLGKHVDLSERIGPYRLATAVYVALFMVLSLVAYLFVFRVETDGGEGNNGYTRALLAQFAYRTFVDHPFAGTTIGLPAVPSDAIYLLQWTQYLTGEEGANIYGLSFHNSLLYLFTRLGIICYGVLLWLVLSGA